MWKRKELKRKARKVIKKNYWTVILVCFLLALITGEFGTSIIGWIQSNDSLELDYVIKQDIPILDETINQDKLEDLRQKAIEAEKKVSEITSKFIPANLTKLETKIIETVKANINSASKSQKYILKIWDAITLFSLDRPASGIMLCVIALIALLYTIIIGDPLIVAGRKYFLEARKGANIKTAGIAADIFETKNWENVATIMFLRNFYNCLWYLTIVGGVIKMYEYRMIPYILAENPQIKRKEAFSLSKKMMENNKWKTFLLDLSFLGWDILSILTFGIVNILYANSYKTATSTELYVKLKRGIRK